MDNTLELEGKRRVLRFTLAACRHFKAAYGKTLWDVRITQPGKLLPEIASDHTCMVYVIWSALLHSDPTLTYDKTEKLLDKYIEDGGDVQALGLAMKAGFKANGLFKSAAIVDTDASQDDKDPNANRDSQLKN